MLFNVKIPWRAKPYRSSLAFSFSTQTKLAISYDQTILESLLAANTVQSFDQARLVYSQGGNSKSIATLTIAAGLPFNVAKGTRLTAEGLDGRQVVGTCETSAVAGSTTIAFRYPVSTNVQNHLDCRVGGLPFSQQITAGCKRKAKYLCIQKRSMMMLG